MAICDSTQSQGKSLRGESYSNIYYETEEEEMHL